MGDRFFSFLKPFYVGLVPDDDKQDTEETGDDSKIGRMNHERRGDILSSVKGVDII